MVVKTMFFPKRLFNLLFSIFVPVLQALLMAENFEGFHLHRHNV